MSQETKLGKRKRVTELKPDPVEPLAKVPKVDRRSRNWFLTWNNYDAESIGVLLNLAQVKSYCIQEEVGEEEGTPHLQGVMTFNTNVRWSALSNACDKKCRWATCKNLAAARNYCSKVKTRAGKQWLKGFRIPNNVSVIDPMDGKVLYDWQQEIIQMISEKAHDRKVYWYWSAEGNVGKSVLCKHMVLKHDAIVVGGVFKDAFYAIVQRVAKRGVGSVHVVVFTLSRSQGNKVSYTAMEQIKDGMFFSAKYESGMCVYNPGHVLVFANVEPDMSQLSSDRWVVKCLDKQGSFEDKRKKWFENRGKWDKVEALANGEAESDLD